ncbi:MAG: RagB/SusD family nutrient uptake outer membrane protein [Muribaculaceae bacterium]|nr:RagB/SusD family nutrient uptake outer membrane protein [Muribaculaceae bacterium]
MNKFFKYIAPATLLLLTVGATSCTKDLNVEPIDPSLQFDVTPEQLINKCYGNFALAGNGGADGDCDVDGIDGGTSGLYRQMWNSNELTTDEAICGWGDEGIPEFCHNSYDATHPMLRGYYYRLTTGIMFDNQYLTEFRDYNKTMSAEVRFLRAMNYYLLLDAFGNVPFKTDISTDKAPRIERAELFKFIEKELKTIVGESVEGAENADEVLADPQPKKEGQAGFGRVDKAAAWLLLARMYLNAEVYTGTARWADAATYAKKVMDSPYVLLTNGSSKEVNGETWDWTPYQMLFMGDNGKTDAAYEGIFTLLSDSRRTTSWGVSLYLIASTFDGDMHAHPYLPDPVNGVTGQAWSGNRARPELVRLFFPNDDAPDAAQYEVAQFAGDDRALFYTEGRKLNVEDESVFTNGFAVAKFNNFTTDGSAVGAGDNRMPNMNVFMMRKAEAYLTYAEALARQNGGIAPAEALAALNVLRNRAHASVLSSANLNTILDEWGREFFFEGRRRIDLVRHNKFGGNTGYNWQWKGGVYAGRNFDAYRNIFDIPQSDIIANNNLQHNPGYPLK